MGRPVGQTNQAQPSVQHTASPSNKVHSHNGGIGKPANIPTGIPVNYQQTQNQWSSQLFDCMNDSENAVITLIAPCVTFGQIAEIVDEGATRKSFIHTQTFIKKNTHRLARIRKKFGLPDAPAPDWITHLVCMPFALCQEYRELKHHGFDPILGWAGNVQQAQPQEMMTPPTGQRMMG
ncbi:unnamed protein product [Arabidopsis thaliana]|uniref:(thale cress) hypothetical protein n=1 Tax=Arabidopsis thaliana TaxID=3702 RepID=A0A7G2ER76_ARATH|nr:unnamed protein product [Arabidopsis thaliana]